MDCARIKLLIFPDGVASRHTSSKVLIFLDCARNKLSIFQDGAASRHTSSKVSIFLLTLHEFCLHEL